MKAKRLSLISITLTAVFLVFTACASTPAEAPADATPEQLIQYAQESYDNGNTNAAIFYYETLLMRYGNSDLNTYIVAQYEIGHLQSKQGKTEQAAKRMQEILSFYEDEELARSLPADYRKLAENELERISAK
ncbi:MAG: hypothetical protein MJ178_04025 [Treponemataceae bacterium]|nr:hypothetical protein [Treponemataceae bacterium]